MQQDKGLTGQRVKPLFFCPLGSRKNTRDNSVSLVHRTTSAVKTLRRFFFPLLYHQLAFSYDLVAATVSVGRWKDWVLSVLPFIEGNRVLEIGHGPGHLQRALLKRSLLAFGIDESSQMVRLARRNLMRFFGSKTEGSRNKQLAYAQINLTRGISQHLPFPAKSFDTLVATFPAEYIFDPKTLVEAQRVLTANGRFVILPGATIMGRGVRDRAMAFLFRVTGETPPDLAEILHERSKKAFTDAGFHVEVHELNIETSLVFILVATKSSM